MSLMGKIFASIGIGSAKVDTVLRQTQLAPGDTAEGVVRIQGGNVEQNVDSIYFSIFTSYRLKLDDDKQLPQTTELGRFRLTKPLIIQPGEQREIPFSFQLPQDTPVTIGKTKVWVQTGLDIDNALDPTDRDYITVLPAAVPAAVLRAINELGFRLKEADCEQAKGIFRGRLPFIQEFEFVPAGGPFARRLEELEVVFRPHETSTEVILQVDRRLKGLQKLFALGSDESVVRLNLTKRDIPNMTGFLQSVIERYALKIW